jgi:hypothetical protein
MGQEESKLPELPSRRSLSVCQAFETRAPAAQVLSGNERRIKAFNNKLPAMLPKKAFEEATTANTSGR